MKVTQLVDSQYQILSISIEEETCGCRTISQFCVHIMQATRLIKNSPWQYHVITIRHHFMCKCVVNTLRKETNCASKVLLSEDILEGW